MAWLADDLDTNVRVRCRIPDGGAVVSQTELLAIADQEISKRFVPYVCALGEDYAIVTTDWPITDGYEAYRIPPRAAGTALRDVVIVDANGVGQSLPRVSLEERDEWATGGSWMWRVGAAFCIQRSEVIIRPGTGLGGHTLRLRYQMRPGRLVLSTSVATVATLQTVTNEVILEVTFTGTDPTDGDVVDWIQATPGFDVLGVDQVITDEGGGVWSLSPGVTRTLSGPSSGAVGDYVALAGTSPVIQLPEPLHPVLEAAVAARVFSLMRDFKAAADARDEVRESLAELRGLFTSRVKGEEQVIVNRRSFLRGGWAR